MNQSIKRLLPILALTIFCSNLGNGIIVPILPVYAETLGANGFWLGFIISSFSIANAIFMPFTGRFSDKHGRKLMLAAGLLGMAITSFAYVWANSIESLLAVRFIQGAAAAMVGPISQAYIGDITPPGQEGKWMGLFNATFIIGYGAGPLLGGVVSQFWGTDNAFYFMGALNIVSMLSVLVFLPEIVDRRQSAGKLSIKSIMASKVTRGIFSFQIGASANRSIMTAFIPVFAVSAAVGLKSSLVGTLLTISLLINSLFQIPTGTMSDKFSRRKMILIGSVGIALAMALTPLSNGFWLLLAILLFGGIADAVSTPPAMAVIVQEGRKYGMGVATSVSNMGSSIGMILAPIIAGFVADAFGISSTFIVAAVIVVVCSSIFGILTRKTAAV